MWLSRIIIKNFRNFRDLDVSLGNHAVILGENKIGKTNLLFALRLILDPTLPDSMRRLRLDDFWDGLPRPLSSDDVIEISIEIRGFETNENLLAVLADHLVQSEPMVSKITYRFQPIPGLEWPPKSESDYEFIIFGGDRYDNGVGYNLRRWMPLDLFPALRDAESDLARWSRSPLRPLLDRATSNVDRDRLEAIAEDVHQTTEEIAELPDMATLVGEVNRQLIGMVGGQHAVETALGFAPTDPDKLLKALQLLIDGGKRRISDASLGSANVLYLALKQLEHQNLVNEGERQHTFLAIEEPEAHLHPHLQRLIYRTYLQTRSDAELPVEQRSILLTTHSPNVVSVTPIHNIVLLHRESGQEHTIGKSLYNIKLEDNEREDLERYIDVTRGEIFFSKAVILVEGESEKFLLPTLSKLYDPELDFDAMGVTVCSIGGTNFTPYIKLLSKKSLGVPFAILTDFDPKGEVTSQEDADPKEGNGDSYGTNRVVNQIMPLLMKKSVYDPATFEFVLEKSSEYGIFLNEFTFEIDLFNSGAQNEFAEAMRSLTNNSKIHSRFSILAEDPSKLNPEEFLKDVNSVGKGRLAQRLASILSQNKKEVCPSYIKSALDYIKGKLE